MIYITKFTMFRGMKYKSHAFIYKTVEFPLTLCYIAITKQENVRDVY